jgi:predicted transcriptional regulator
MANKGKKGNAVESLSFTITLSVQSVQLLDEIAKRGIYGRNRPEVVARFIDRALEAFVDQPKARLPEIKLG